MIDSLFTNGVIAVKEKLLLGDKLLRFTEMTAEEVLRALTESGFGAGAESREGEALCEAEERALDAFIREYSPAKAETAYLLAPRDFHNAKALCKAAILKTDAQKMLAPEGLIPIDVLSAAIEEGAKLEGELGKAVQMVLEGENLTGTQIGAIFDAALYRHLAAVCKHNRLLKKLLAGRADRTNILTALRAKEEALAKSLYVGGGTLGEKALSVLFETDIARLENAFKGTPYADFFALCLSAKEKGLPFTEAERALESFEAEYFYAKRFELEGKQPFLYYVFRRRAEIRNVRILLVCLSAGLSAPDIKRRLCAV